ncbi:hypothetical protein KKF31_10955, partial [bacterium]|nr:hypothetical protein [bacterium]
LRMCQSPAGASGHLRNLRAKTCRPGAGGTNPSLVEAMYLGLPILAYGVQYNRETTEGKALYFDDKDGLVKLLENIDEEQLQIVAHDMFVVAKENYVWEKIAKQYAELF